MQSKYIVFSYLKTISWAVQPPHHALGCCKLTWGMEILYGGAQIRGSAGMTPLLPNIRNRRGIPVICGKRLQPEIVFDRSQNAVMGVALRQRFGIELARVFHHVAEQERKNAVVHVSAGLVKRHHDQRSLAQLFRKGLI